MKSKIIYLNWFSVLFTFLTYAIILHWNEGNFQMSISPILVWVGIWIAATILSPQNHRLQFAIIFIRPLGLILAFIEFLMVSLSSLPAKDTLIGYQISWESLVAAMIGYIVLTLLSKAEHKMLS